MVEVRERGPAVTELPNSKKYPTSYRDGSGVGIDVKYERVGKIIRAKINETFAARIGGLFFFPPASHSDGPVTLSDLQKAQQYIDYIDSQNLEQIVRLARP